MSRIGKTGDRRREFIKKIAATGCVGVIGVSGCLSSDDESEPTDNPGNGDNSSGSDDSDSSADTQGEQVPELSFASLAESSHPTNYEAGAMQAEAFRELGLDVDFFPVETGELIDMINNETFEHTAMMSWGPSGARLDPDFYLSFWEEGNDRDNWYWHEDEYQELIAEQRQVYDQEERRDIVYRLQEIWTEHQPATPLFRSNFNNPYNHERVSIPEPIPPGDGNMSFWTRTYLEPADGVSTVRFGYPIQIDSLNTLSPLPGMGGRTVQIIYDMLFRVDAEGAAQPWMVEEYDFVDDTTIDITLRDDLEFHDGEPVTADDVKFSYELTAEQAGRWSSNAAVFENIEVESDTELQFELSEPNATVFTLTFSVVPILPEHIWSEVDEPLDFENEDAIGSGPWELNYWRRGEEMSLIANENHFEPPTHEEQLFVPHSGRSAMLRSLETEEIDLWMGEAPSVEQQDRIDEIDHLSLQPSGDFGISYLIHDTRDAPFDDKAFRRALSHANPIEQILNVLMDGNGTPSHSPITEANTFWHNSDIEKLGDDVEAGRQELEDAGYTWDDDDRLHYPE